MRSGVVVPTGRAFGGRTWPSKSERYDALTSLRGICAMAVALFHFPIYSLTRAVGLIAHAYLFVDFFFALSGFVIASSYEDQLTNGLARAQFAIRRFGRLWPLHVSLLAVFVAAALARHQLGDSERHSVFAILTNLTLIHGLGIHHELTWNEPSWSISVEAALYVLFLGLSFLKSAIRPFIYAGLVGFALLGLMRWAPYGMASTFDFGIFRGLAGFFVGALLAKMLPANHLKTRHELAIVGAAGLFVSLGWATLAAPVVFGATVYILAHSTGAVSRALKHPALVWLGERSYSVYLVHAALTGVLFAAARPLGLHREGAALVDPSLSHALADLALYVLAVIGLSALTYVCIEKPARMFFNGLARNVHSPVPSPGAAALS